jgi:hypothetical protein
MKGILFVALLGLAFAGSGLQQQVGASCDKSPTFAITSFDANPWPVQRAQQYTLTITGTFNANDYIEQIYIGQKKDLDIWHYTYQTVQKQYQKGNTVTFTVSVQGPSEIGSYTEQISFHRHDLGSLACWQYTYTL